MGFASVPGAATAKVEAPDRTSTTGQPGSLPGVSSRVPSPGCAGEPKKNAFIRSVNEPDFAAGAGAAAGGEDDEPNRSGADEHAAMPAASAPKSTPMSAARR